jgi:hypothetical protein
VLKDELLMEYALMDLSKPNALVLFSNVDQTKKQCYQTFSN